MPRNISWPFLIQLCSLRVPSYAQSITESFRFSESMKKRDLSLICFKNLRGRYVGSAGHLG